MNMIKTEIDLTEKHIQDGVKGTCTLCPGALAISEHVREGIRVSVSRDHLSLKDKASLVQHIQETPIELMEFINRFDDGDPLVKPITFFIDIPVEFLPRTAEELGGVVK